MISPHRTDRDNDGTHTCGVIIKGREKKRETATIHYGAAAAFLYDRHFQRS
jgi:hypothetical protein